MRAELPKIGSSISRNHDSTSKNHRKNSMKRSPSLLRFSELRTSNSSSKLFVQDTELLQTLGKESNAGIIFSDEFKEPSLVQYKVPLSDVGDTDDESNPETMSLASHVGKVFSGYMVLYKQSANVLYNIGHSQKPRWVSLTQGGKLVICKRGEDGHFLGKPRIIDLSEYDKCELVGTSESLITIYSCIRSSNVTSYCLVAPDAMLAWTWVDLISTSINQHKFRRLVKGAIQKHANAALSMVAGSQCDSTDTTSLEI